MTETSDIVIEIPLKPDEIRILADLVFEAKKDVHVHVKRKEGDFVIVSILFRRRRRVPTAQARATYADGSVNQNDIHDQQSFRKILENWIVVP